MSGATATTACPRLAIASIKGPRNATRDGAKDPTNITVLLAAAAACGVAGLRCAAVITLFLPAGSWHRNGGWLHAEPLFKIGAKSAARNHLSENSYRIG
jgi:hypothetical protein